MNSLVTTGGPRPETPTIWGLTPSQVHDRFWASRGVQVVRCGEPSEIVESAELYLLVDPLSLVVFRLRALVEVLSWLQPKLLVVRVRDEASRGYSEVVQSSDTRRFRGFRRLYAGLDSRLARVGLTPSREVARMWQQASSFVDAWRGLRHRVPMEDREVRVIPGRVFDSSSPDQLMSHLEWLMETWGHPDSTIPRVQKGPSGLWIDEESTVPRRISAIGTVWVGAGRSVPDGELVVGPAILWDDPEFAAPTDSVPWLDLEPLTFATGLEAQPKFLRVTRVGKRCFDVVFSLFALALTLPLYPFIILAILWEDGWPPFFAHRRETLGGREFPCLKFRSMKKDAEKIKEDLVKANQSDGPQFFVTNDPRSTRVGRFLRKTQLDEIPQFWNVLLGQMSVVGPRPSPRRENQFCPAWRETRLSVRPGVTGLWQVKRTRAEGLDFQEWIRYDLEYVERMSWRLDLSIIWQTLGVMWSRGKGQ